MLRYLLLNFFQQATTAALAPYAQIIFRNKGYSHSLTGVFIALGQIASVIVPVLVCLTADRTRKTRLIAAIIAASCTALIVPAALSGSVAISGVAYFLMCGLFWSLNPMMDGYQNRQFAGDTSKYGIVRSFGTFGYLVFLTAFAFSGFPDESDNRSIVLNVSAVLALFVITLAFAPRDIRQNRIRKADRMFFSFKWFDGKFYLMMLVAGLSRVGDSVVEHLLSSYMTEVLGVGRYFTLFIAMGALSEIMMLTLGGRMLHKGRISAWAMVMLSSAGLMLRLLIYFFFPGKTAFAFAQLLHSFTFGAFHIGMSKYIVDNVRKEHYSVAMSYYWAVVTNLPEMLGVLLGGFVIDRFGYSVLFLSYCIFPALSLLLGFSFRRILKGSK